MDAGTSRTRRPGQVGGPIGMPESMRSQMLTEMGTIDVTQEVPINRPVAQQRAPQGGMPPMGYPPQQQPHQMYGGPVPPQQYSDPYGQYLLPMPLQQRSYSPVPQNRKPISSRRSSMTSTTSGAVKGLFKNWRHNNNSNNDYFPDDDVGQDIDTNDEITFSDLQHIRDRGRYGVNNPAPFDTTSYIPTLTSKPLGSSGQRPGKLSNTEYRKQVTAAKKLLYVQAANGAARPPQPDARAMSLQSMNQMYQQGPTDPRTMSMIHNPIAGNNKQFYALPPQLGPRAMSLTNMGPRAMSFNGPGPGPIPNQRFPPQGMRLGSPAMGQPRQLPFPQQQQQLPYRGSPYMQQQPHYPGQVVPPGSTPGSTPRLNSLSGSGSLDNIKKSSIGGRSNGSVSNSANTSLQSIPEVGKANLEASVRSSIGGSADVPQERTQEDLPEDGKPTRVLKKINFNSSTSLKTEKNVDEFAEKANKSPNRNANETSPLKSMTSAYSVSSGEYPTRNSNAQEMYALGHDNTDVFVTASQFSLENIEEESKPLDRQSTLKGDSSIHSESISTSGTIHKIPTLTLDSSKVPPLNSRTSSFSSEKSLTVEKGKRRSFLKRISFGKSNSSSKKVPVIEEPERRLSVKSSAPVVDDFQYSQPTAGRQIRDFSFGSETEMLRTAPLNPSEQDDAVSSVVSMDNSLGVTEPVKPKKSSAKRTPPPDLVKKEVEERRVELPSLPVAVSSPISASATPVEPVKHTQNQEKHIEKEKEDAKESVPKLNFTVEQLGIMRSNTKMLKELELVSGELADSISREFELESRLEKLQKGQTQSTSISSENSNRDKVQVRKQSEEIAKLVTQLAEERKKRYIAEEHVLRWEHGVKPSPLESSYKHSDLERQNAKLLETIKEYESKLKISTNENIELLSKTESLLKENDRLKADVIPNLENQITMLENSQQMKQLEDKYQQLKLKNEELRSQIDGVKSIEDQKQALRQALKSMKENYDMELRQANEKIKHLEEQVRPQQQQLQLLIRVPSRGALSSANSLKYDYSNNTTDDSPMSTPTPSRKILPVVFDE